LAKRIEIKRATSDSAREMIAEQISKSVVDLRGNYPEQIEDAVDGLDFTASQLRYPPVFDKLLRESTINDLLDLIYLDLFVQYADMFNLQDSMARVRAIFDSAIVAMVNRIGEIASKVRDFSTLSDSQLSFTNTIHESFNSQSNRSASLSRLSINPGAGVLRTAGEVEDYCTIDKSSVYLVPISESVRQIDTTDPNLVYNSDPTEPFYTTLITNTYPSNPSYPSFLFSAYTGAIVDVVIRFTGVFPINRITFAPFSNAPVEVIGLFYSDIIGIGWDEVGLNQITLSEINTDNIEVELNFDRVYARELHLLLRQDKFMLSHEEREILHTNSMGEYIDYCCSAMDRLLREGFSEVEDVATQISELVDAMKREVALPVEKLNANTRSYTVGLYNLKAQNVVYSVYGNYESDTTSLRGNLSSVSLAFSGNLWHVSDSGAYDTTALFSIATAEREVFMGVPLGTNNEIIDAVVVEENRKFEQGVMIPVDTHMYKIETHFVPDDNYLDDLEIYADGEKLDLPDISPLGLVINKKDYGTEIEVPTEFALNNNIYDGSVVTMRYILSDTDRFGRAYDVESVDILYVLGKPNISDNTSADIFSQYIYTVERDEDEVVTASRSYEPTEYSPILISGELYYCVYSGKGETISGDVIEIGSKMYVKDSSVVGPFDSFYYGSIREEPTFVESGVVVGSGICNRFETDAQYVKGTLKAFEEGYYIPGVTEYETDTPAVVLVGDEKKEILVPSGASTDIRVSYIPIDKTATSKYINTNIAQFNMTERYTKTQDKKVQLTRYPFIDRSIITSHGFDFSGGIFSLKYKYSIIYEPLVVYVNGVKAINMTEYRTGEKPKFPDKKRATDYRYYVEAGKTVVFNDDVTGNIVIYYYILSDSFSTRISMFRSNYFRDDVSPELYNYTILANVQR
jgi:hypothetical protein